MATYNPNEPVDLNTLEDVREWVKRELRQVAQALSETDALELRTVHRPPIRPRDGMIASADGTDWNPGAGVGIYGRVAGVWVKLS